MTILSRSKSGTNLRRACTIIAVIILGLQYLIGPSMVGWTMRVKWVSEKEEPELHRMVAELARGAGLPKPKVGISQLSIPNAFAFGRTRRDGRVCVTHGIMGLLNKDELRAVLGHEISQENGHSRWSGGFELQTLNRISCQ